MIKKYSRRFYLVEIVVARSLWNTENTDNHESLKLKHTCFFPRQVSSAFLSQCWSWSHWVPVRRNQNEREFCRPTNIFSVQNFPPERHQGSVRAWGRDLQTFWSSGFGKRGRLAALLEGKCLWCHPGKHLEGKFGRDCPWSDKTLKGIVHNFFYFRSDLIFWIVMGCGIGDFARRGL